MVGVSLLHEMLQHNDRWIAERSRPLSKAPQKRVVIFTCMDTRLVEFLEPALGLRRGDAKMIKNAGNTLDPVSGTVSVKGARGTKNLSIAAVRILRGRR